MRKTCLVMLVAMLLCPVGVIGRAQSDAASAEAQRIFSEVMSPYCPGKVLADCTSLQAAELRAEIRKRLDAGETAEEILNGLYARFGEEIRPAPPVDSPWGRFLWTVPLLW